MSPWRASWAVCTEVSVASTSAARAALLMETEYDAAGLAGCADDEELFDDAAGVVLVWAVT